MTAYLLIRGGEGGQNFGKSAYIILEQSLGILLYNVFHKIESPLTESVQI